MSRWWRGLSLSVWLSKDGLVRGIVSLGAVTVEEFQAAVERRWPVTLRAIDPATVREEVYAVIRPGLIADFGSDRGRYQPLKFYLGPKRRAERKRPQTGACEASGWVEPMPVLVL